MVLLIPNPVLSDVSLPADYKRAKTGGVLARRIGMYPQLQIKLSSVTGVFIHPLRTVRRPAAPTIAITFACDSVYVHEEPVNPTNLKQHQKAIEELRKLNQVTLRFWEEGFGLDKDMVAVDRFAAACSAYIENQHVHDALFSSISLHIDEYQTQL
ncbi:hypothetical protein BJ742DRAFT_772692 [Cladochytrium replicatum]|nr:hypothetical protein BJ742DRAFT_772692 [Cladochytrium replicatum]